MKNTQKGFIVPLLLLIVAVLLVGGGAYFYTQTKQTNPQVIGNLPIATSTAQATDCTDFNTLSQFVLNTIEKPDSSSAIQMNKSVITSFHWRRNSSEPYISYPITNGVSALYNNQQTLMSAIKSDSGLLNASLDVEAKSLGLTADVLNTIPFQSFDFGPESLGSYLQVFGFVKGGSLYSIVLKAEQSHQSQGQGVVTITCGTAINQYDKVFNALNFKSDIAVQDPYDYDYVAIGDISPDNSVYALLGSPNHIKIAPYYYFDGNTTKLVSKDSYPATCATLESQKVGKGMRCVGGPPNYIQRQVNY